MSQDTLNLLLIEHDADFGGKVADMLRQTRDNSASTLKTVSHLEEGLAALTAGDPFDLVIFDVSLPDGAGLANVGLIRARAPQLPVIVTGDSDSEAIAVEAVHAGAQDYLVKGQLTPGWLERSMRYAIERYHLDQSLKAAEEKYHNVFDHLVEGIFQTTPQGRYLMANMALARIYGYSSPEELIQGMQDISTDLYVAFGRREEFVAAMQQNDLLTGFESQVRRKDGTVIWISENCRAVRDSKGGLFFYEGTVEDVTQRRTVEERLRKSEALYHSLVETLPQNIFRKNLVGRFTFGNQQFCKTLGRSLGDIVGRTDFDFFPPKLAEKYQQDDRNVLETRQPYDTVEEHQPPGHGKIYVQVVKTPICDADGKVLGLQGIFWDITQQKLADEKIRKANAELDQSRKELRGKNEEMEDDLRMAREIQMTMLPQSYPDFPRSISQPESAFKFTHRYLPTGTVGGDFFTISALSETLASVFVCDVAGHGIRSALVTAMIRALVEELKPVATDPGQFLSKLNLDLCAILKNTGSPLLTTAFYLVADAETGRVSFANAGHPKPVRISRQKGVAQVLTVPGTRPQPALGLFENARYVASSAELSPGDVLVLFTDGLVEVHNRNEDLWTEEQLLSSLQSRACLPPEQILQELLAEIKDFSEGSNFTDDVCLVAMEFVGPSEKRG